MINILFPLIVFKKVLFKFQLLDIDDDGYAELMDDDNITREDLKLPENAVGEEIKKKFADEVALKITVLKAMDEEVILSWKLDLQK